MDGGAQIRDPYYKFSRDPDMSLDTAPYPAGVPRPGMLSVRRVHLLPACSDSEDMQRSPASAPCNCSFRGRPPLEACLRCKQKFET